MQFLLLAFAFVFFCSCDYNQDAKPSANTSSTATEKNKEIIRQVFSEMVVKQNYSLVDSFFATNIFEHSAPTAQGVEKFKKEVSEFLGMFSQVNIQVEDMLAEGDRVSTRETWKVIRKSDQKELSGAIMHWFLLKDGKITEEWSTGWDWLGL